jgi:hypothetical protein
MALFDEPLIPKKSLRGIMLDKMVKAVFLNAVSYTDGICSSVVEEKLKHGFVNPEMKVLYDIFTDIITVDEQMRNKGQDHIRDMYTGLRNIVVVTLDEDSHYFTRFLMFCHLIHDRYPEIEELAKKSKMVMDFEQQAKWFDEQVKRKNAGLPIDYTPLTAIKNNNIHPKSPELIKQIRDEKEKETRGEGALK